MNQTVALVNSIAALRRHSKRLRGQLCQLAATPSGNSVMSLLAATHELLHRTEAQLLGCSARLLESEEEPTKGNET